MNIESWEKCLCVNGMFAKPTEPGGVFRGIIYGHPTIPDGQVITTGKILGWDFRDACFVDENNLEIRLRNPSSDYSGQFKEPLELILRAAVKRQFMMPRFLYDLRYKDERKPRGSNA